MFENWFGRNRLSEPRNPHKQLEQQAATEIVKLPDQLKDFTVHALKQLEPLEMEPSKCLEDLFADLLQDQPKFGVHA